MVKVFLERDDYYAWFPFTDRGIDPVDVPAETLGRWEHVLDEFEQVQREMEEAANGN